MSDTKMSRRDIFKKRLKKLTDKDILQAMKDTVDSGYDFFRKKLADYGVGAFKAAGGIGVAGKIREKYARFDNLMKTDGEPNFESIHDSIHDLAWWALTLESMLDKGVVDLVELREQYRAIYGEDDEKDSDDT